MLKVIGVEYGNDSLYYIKIYPGDYIWLKYSTRSRIIYWIIIGTIIFGIALLPFIYVDVSVQARGYFQSEIEKQIIYTPFQGKIVFSSIHNGDRVTKGDTLLIINSETVRAQQTALIQRIAENDASIVDLEKLTKTDSLENQIFPEELQHKDIRLNSQISETSRLSSFKNIQKKKTEHERNELLYNQEIIPETDYENSLFMLSSEKDNLNQILLYQKSLWQSDLTMRRNEAVNLLADFEQCTEEINQQDSSCPNKRGDNSKFRYSDRKYCKSRDRKLLRYLPMGSWLQPVLSSLPISD